MEALLKVAKSSGSSEDPLIPHSPVREPPSAQRISVIEDEQSEAHLSSPEDVLKILKSKAPTSTLLEALKFLDPASLENGDFNIIIPSSLGAQILHALITTTICDHWASLGMEHDPESSYQLSFSQMPQAMLLRCVKSPSGIGTLLAYLRSLLPTQTPPQGTNASSDKGLLIQDTLSLLSRLLSPSDLIFHLLTDIRRFIDNEVRKQLLWQETISLIASGKVLSISAESLSYTELSVKTFPHSWMSNGKLYAAWLGKNISSMASQFSIDDDQAWKYLGAFISRSLSIGQTDQVVDEILHALLFRKDRPGTENFINLLKFLRQHDQKRILESILRCLERAYLVNLLEKEDKIADESISNVSILLSLITRDVVIMKETLKNWLISGIGGSINSVYMRRSLLATFASDPDKLSIKHSPIPAQEANAQVILLAAGYLHRLETTDLSSLVQASSYLSAISNRLGAASTRSRFLGMIVGTSLSKLTDKPESRMKFDLAEMDSDEASWFLKLADTKDRVRTITDLKPPHTLSSTETVKERALNVKHEKMQGSSAKPTASKILPLEDPDESNDDGLIPYQKPDADTSDSDEDPTLIQRSKPTPPVYIRELLTYLRDIDNYDRYILGISTAPSLIRRKSGFGSELDEHIRDLALTLTSLHDKYNVPKFQEYRLQSLTTLVVARPLVLGPWIANAFFHLDLSQSQRSSLLVALGLGARELAGYREEDSKAMSLPQVSADASFPSQRLPNRLEIQYDPASKHTPNEAISRNITRTSLEPLALNAADTLSGPNALKVRTFSSRMEVEKKKHEQEQLRRAKSIPKDLHKILFEAFFRPLTSGFSLMMYSTSSYNGNNPFFSPHLLSLFIQTTILVISTIGPSSVNQLTITSDVLMLLMSLHNSAAATEPTVLSAILSLFLAVLDINIASGSSGEERLVNEFAEQVMEMREWVGGIFERTPKGDDQVRMLAAGIMVKLGEVMNRYQGRLFGINAKFSF
ncbi:protein kinase subdomain-containing protein [Trichophyton rubrum]|uniref:Protein kinase subdomain-containing protein n=1 Tax=Trichophyton rubrum TaxID=5551 RepID=A0A178F638_TRIRU|nr:protein kinase subdomain-containing protein [Trichophyton rubrum]